MVRLPAESYAQGGAGAFRLHSIIARLHGEARNAHRHELEEFRLLSETIGPAVEVISTLEHDMMVPSA